MPLTYTAKEAAEITGFHPRTIRRAMNDGEIKFADGRPRRISRIELERWWRDVKGGGDLFPDQAEADA